ncbi:hypothetical protein V8G54_003390 [Vigna mungo]|uniref:Uncharacterized protein n=1 Tax=Vigna mungo TaxID=3915 RepID=A0AAQ3PBQ0_VIGMU
MVHLSWNSSLNKSKIILKLSSLNRFYNISYFQLIIMQAFVISLQFQQLNIFVKVTFITFSSYINNDNVYDLGEILEYLSFYTYLKIKHPCFNYCLLSEIVKPGTKITACSLLTPPFFRFTLHPLLPK